MIICPMSIFFKKINPIKVFTQSLSSECQYSLVPDRARPNVGPDLGPKS